MNAVPTMEEAQKLLEEYNQDAFHLKHAKIVSGVMGYFAKEYDPENVEFWKVVGLLHDLDFEQYPEQHCIKEQEIMRARGLDERLIHAVASHGYGITVDIKPEHIMEKILYATDELTGLIGAVALMHPSKSVRGMQLKSVKKKFKTPSFAAGCSREVIQKGADMLGWTLDELITRTIEAMQPLCDELGI
ncbi:MAG: putative hydrolase (HD superfamily) [Thermocaproicibacter melissae]|jgi:putative nucleotidyltransferase with HDIG domain|uniref:HDIG domain-containing metalloprotein n=1 Tax=Thermocaproicibacter melissae TaxID=2966552 RepID=UPI003A102706